MKKINFHIIYLSLAVQLILSPGNLFGSDKLQDYTKLEELLENSEYTIDISFLAEALDQLQEEPVNLRTATVEDLASIPSFNIVTATKVLLLVKNEHIYDRGLLARKAGLNDIQAYLLLHCTITAPEKKQKSYFKLRHRYKGNNNVIAGFQNNKYLGSKDDFYQKYLYKSENISFGLTIDKDAGELYLADFYSSYLQFNYLNSNIIIGDYVLRSGMGSTLWNSFGMRKGADVSSPVLQTESLLKGNTSTMDSYFFRGVAINKIWELNNLEFHTSAWYANSPRSGSVDTNSYIISSFYRDSYYRTETEIEKKNSLCETNIGSEISIKNDRINIGACAFHLNYDKEIVSESKQSFRGKSGLLTNMFAKYHDSSKAFGIEIAKDAPGNMGYKAGAQFAGRSFDYSFAYRSFARNFRSPFGYNFGESQSPANETGLFSGICWKGNDKLLINSYIDIYSSYGPTYFVPERVDGIDIFSEAEYYYNSATKIKLRLKAERKKDSYTNDPGDKIIYYNTLARLRLELQKKFNRSLSFRCRFEYCRTDFNGNKNTENGYLAFTEFSFLPIRKLKLSGRFTYFSSDSYDSAIWLYEYSIPGNLYTVPLYGSGIRYNMTIKYSPCDFFRLFIKYSVMEKYNVSSLSSGYNEIYGNIDERFIIQWDLTL